MNIKNRAVAGELAVGTALARLVVLLGWLAWKYGHDQSWRQARRCDVNGPRTSGHL